MSNNSGPKKKQNKNRGQKKQSSETSNKTVEGSGNSLSSFIAEHDNKISLSNGEESSPSLKIAQADQSISAAQEDQSVAVTAAAAQQEDQSVAAQEKHSITAAAQEDQLEAAQKGQSISAAAKEDHIATAQEDLLPVVAAAAQEEHSISAAAAAQEDHSISAAIQIAASQENQLAAVAQQDQSASAAGEVNYSIVASLQNPEPLYEVIESKYSIVNGNYEDTRPDEVNRPDSENLQIRYGEVLKSSYC
jgi:hypothetical protein